MPACCCQLAPKILLLASSGATAPLSKHRRADSSVLSSIREGLHIPALAPSMQRLRVYHYLILSWNHLARVSSSLLDRGWATSIAMITYSTGNCRSRFPPRPISYCQVLSAVKARIPISRLDIVWGLYRAFLRSASARPSQARVRAVGMTSRPYLYLLVIQKEVCC
jgi:hypothetical protein